MIKLPKINPVNEEYAIGGLHKIVMRHISTNKLIYFEKSAYYPWWLIEVYLIK